MASTNTPLWRVNRVTDTSKLEGGEFVDYRDIEIRIHNGDIVHVLIPSKDYTSDKAAEQIAEEMFSIVDTLQLQSQQTVDQLPISEVDLEGNVNRSFPMSETGIEPMA